MARWQCDALTALRFPAGLAPFGDLALKQLQLFGFGLGLGIAGVEDFRPKFSIQASRDSREESNSRALAAAFTARWRRLLPGDSHLRLARQLFDLAAASLLQLTV